MGLEDERQAFLRLQLQEQANSIGDLLAALETLLGVGSVAGSLVERVAVIVAARAEQPLPGAPQRERLSAGHHLHPGGEVPRIGGQGLGEQDLDRALVGVLGIVHAERVTTSGASQGRLGGGKLRQRIAPRAGEGLGEVGPHLRVKPAPPPPRPQVVERRLREQPCRLSQIGQMGPARRYAQPRR